MFDYLKKGNINVGGERIKDMITVGGMIGAGKSTITKMIADEMGYRAFYEDVDDNEILPLFYTASDEEKMKKRYPFLLQLDFLNSRYGIIKESLRGGGDIVMDRSIYEDWYFAKINHEIGDISKQEFNLYEKLLSNMMEELEELPKKSPDLMIYLKISFEETMKRINARGRDFEQDDKLVDYYYKLWKGYDDWINNFYDKSDVLIINMDIIDIEKYPRQKEDIIKEIKRRLGEMQ